MIITKYTFYQVPFRKNDNDRIIENIDIKLNKFLKEEFLAVDEKVSYNITNEIVGLLTVSSKNKYNYVKIESDLYIEGFSYHFLSDLSEIESGEAYQYNVTLDVIATFGKKVLDSLNTKQVEIKRMHQDRYYGAGGLYFINRQHYGLLNSNFQVGSTVGQKVTFDGNGSMTKQFPNNETLFTPSNMVDINDNDNRGLNTGRKIWKVGGEKTNDGDGYMLKEDSIFINNAIRISFGGDVNKRYWVYAIVQGKGDPEITTSEYNNIYICPVSMEKQKASPNTLKYFEELPQGKVLQIVVSPWKYLQYGIDTETMYFQTKYIGDKAGGQTSNISNHLFYFKISANVYEVVAMFGSTLLTTAFETDFPTSIKTSKLGNDKYIMDKFVRMLTIDEFKKVIESTNMEDRISLEIGLLNKSISPITFKYSNNYVVLDIYNFLNKNNIDVFEGSHNFSPIGISTTLKLTDYDYITWNEQVSIDYFSDAGATYLAQNKYSVAAAKQGIELQNEMRLKEISIQQSTTYSGGIIGMLLSLPNPATGITSKRIIDQQGVANDIEINEKRKIDGTIRDAYASPPSRISAKVDDYSYLGESSQFKYKWNWWLTTPNDVIMRKIYFYLQKFGYKVEDYLVFNSDIWHSRRYYNYLKIDNVIDYIGSVNLSDSVIKEFTEELMVGIRIWHSDDLVIDYNLNNIEKKICDDLDICV